MYLLIASWFDYCPFTLINLKRSQKNPFLREVLHRLNFAECKRFLRVYELTRFRAKIRGHRDRFICPNRVLIPFHQPRRSIDVAHANHPGRAIKRTYIRRQTDVAVCNSVLCRRIHVYAPRTPTKVRVPTRYTHAQKARQL